MRYTINRTAALTAPDADWDRPQWQAAEILAITHFPWADSGHRPRVQVRALYDERALALIFRVEDRYVRAVAERFQDGVCTDSCVEFFVAPITGSQAYFNFEVNC
ncbi:MAG: carbohydrate-binding family 9-like protein, partial [Candidatus Latescibacteria bacterium]|nr:carbohydrate-binding family 9-like protein [Candidatus Latescibacterota bacterium]